jgi:hypothetical protein
LVPAMLERQLIENARKGMTDEERLAIMAGIKAKAEARKKAEAGRPVEDDEPEIPIDEEVEEEAGS